MDSRCVLPPGAFLRSDAGAILRGETGIPRVIEPPSRGGGVSGARLASQGVSKLWNLQVIPGNGAAAGDRAGELSRRFHGGPGECRMTHLRARFFTGSEFLARIQIVGRGSRL